MTPEEKLARIADLCNDFPPDAFASWKMRDEVRAVLDAPSAPAARAGGIDQDALATLLGAFSGEAFGSGDIDYGAWADRVLALVQPAPPALDLAVVRRILAAALPAEPKWAGWVEGRIEEIAAEGAPGGVYLTPGDASAVISGLRWASLHPTEGAPESWGSRWQQIAARLGEASS